MKTLGPRGGQHANPDQLRMRQIWRTKEWKARIKELLLANQRCEWCNGKSSVVNHRRQGYYEGYELCRREEVDIICQPCHLHWTKTNGQKRPRMYDDCADCAAPIYLGRKVCFQCGGNQIIGKKNISEQAAKDYETVLARCPEVKIGDRWEEVWAWEGEVVVKGFEPQSDLPWPLVKTDRGSVGLPAFIFGKLIEQGTGDSYS